jgi:16S rRNA processing protein RimM
MKEEAEYRTLARITRPRGNRGEVRAENLSGGLRNFRTGSAVRVVLPNRQQLTLTIDRAWEHKGRLVLKFAGIDSITEAERLRLGEVLMKKEALGPLPQGEYFLNDLLGCRLVDEGTGRDMGAIAEVYEPPGGVLLFSVVDSEQKEMLVPFANEICRNVDIGSKRILVRLPEGMEDLKA